MSLAKGSTSYLAAQRETTWNENVSAAGSPRLVSFSSESLGGNVNAIQSDEITANRAVTGVRGGNISAGGSISTDFAPLKSGLFLSTLFGYAAIPTASSALSVEDLVSGKYYVRGQIAKDNTGTGVDQTGVFICIKGGLTSSAALDLSGGGVGGIVVNGTTEWQRIANVDQMLYRYSYTPQSSLAASLAIEKKLSSNIFLQYSGCRIGGMTLNIPQEGILKADWNVVGARVTKTTATAIASPTAAPTDTPFMGTDCTVYLGAGREQTLLDPMAAGYATARSFTPRVIRDATLSFNNDIDENVFVLGSRYRAETPEQVRKVEGTLNTYFEDATELNAFLAETEVTIQYVLVVAPYLMVIKMPYCRMTGNGIPSVTGPGLLTASYNYAAFDAGSQDDITIDVYSFGTNVPS